MSSFNPAALALQGNLLLDDAGLVVRAGLHGLGGVHHARVPQEALWREAYTGKWLLAAALFFDLVRRMNR